VKWLSMFVGGAVGCLVGIGAIGWRINKFVRGKNTSANDRGLATKPLET